MNNYRDRKYQSTGVPLPNTSGQPMQSTISQGTSGHVTNSSIQWWSEQEEWLFNVWASSYEQYNTSFVNPYFDYFFTGQDIQVSLYGLHDPQDVLPIYSLGYNMQQEKMPIYGFWEYTYSAMLRGTRIISGAFSLVSMYPHLLTKAIAKAALNISKSTNSSAKRIDAVRTLDDDENNISKFWSSQYDNNLDINQQHLFSVHPPFHFVIRYGVQSNAYTEVENGKTQIKNIERRSRDIKNVPNNYMLTDVNERLVNALPEIQTTIVLENIEITSKSITYGVDGQPILENYTFIARDERILANGLSSSYGDPGTVYTPRSSSQTKAVPPINRVSLPPGMVG